MNPITKAVIPCGGLGTRFLPITKAVSKEILPIVDTPVLAYIVDEAIDSGVTDIMIVLGKNKDDIKKYFTPGQELEDKLLAAGKDEYYRLVNRIHTRANIIFSCQEVPRGSGDAVLYAKGFTGDEAFVLSWGDDLIIGRPPVMKQLMDAYSRTGKTILGVQRYPLADIYKYGVAKVLSSEGAMHRLSGIVEKPTVEEAPSDLASLGRYILTKEVYAEIQKTAPGKNGELQLTDTLNNMCKSHGVYACEFTGRRYDMGDKLGAMQAAVELSLSHPEFGERFRAYLIGLSKTL
ncbi:MAG: UTP--glucose-1-phosphate uridylyltransferase [Clostridiales bacterium]|jgi:UTP--glucose-1-phosphate uridylyltransferase|nr:UTP--glucose-1-phosphate uridylyltransferase [Clostridiales bacterium]